MHAHGLGVHGDDGAVNGGDGAGGGHLSDAPQYLLGAVEHGAGLVAAHQGAVREVGAVGEGLADHRHPASLGQVHGRAAGQ